MFSLMSIYYVLYAFYPPTPPASSATRRVEPVPVLVAASVWTNLPRSPANILFFKNKTKYLQKKVTNSCTPNKELSRNRELEQEKSGLLR